METCVLIVTLENCMTEFINFTRQNLHMCEIHCFNLHARISRGIILCTSSEPMKVHRSFKNTLPVTDLCMNTLQMTDGARGSCQRQMEQEGLASDRPRAPEVAIANGNVQGLIDKDPKSE